MGLYRIAMLVLDMETAVFCSCNCFDFKVTLGGLLRCQIHDESNAISAACQFIKLILDYFLVPGAVLLRTHYYFFLS